MRRISRELRFLVGSVAFVACGQVKSSDGTREITDASVTKPVAVRSSESTVAPNVPPEVSHTETKRDPQDVIPSGDSPDDRPYGTPSERDPVPEVVIPPVPNPEVMATPMTGTGMSEEKPSAPTMPAMNGRVSAAFIGQSILHQPGTKGSGITGKNLFHWFRQWGGESVHEEHWTQGGVGLQEHTGYRETNQLIAKGLNYFVMGEGTMFLWTRKRTESDARAFMEKAKKAGSEPVLYIPYAHRGDGSLPYDRPDDVMKEYMAVAAKLGIKFIPVAAALGVMETELGANNVYTDNVHVTADAQFLAGCVTWATLTKTPSDKIVFQGNADGVRLDRQKLIDICKRTVAKYPQ